MTHGPTFRPSRRSFYLLLTTALCMTLATYAARMMSIYKALDLGAGPLELGILASSFAALSVMCVIPIGRLLDIVGERPLTLAGVAVLASSAAMMVRATAIWQVALGLAVLGLGQTTAVIANQASVARMEYGTSADSRYGTFSAATSIGQLLGPAVAGTVAGMSAAAPNIDAALLVAAGVSALGLVTAFFVRLAPRPAPHTRGSDRERGVKTSEALKSIRATPGIGRALLVSMTVLSSIDVLTAYLPALGESRGLGVQTVGLLLSVRAAASLASRIGMGTIVAKLGRKRALMGSVLVPAAALTALPFAPSAWFMAALLAFVGLGLGLGQPITLSWIATSVPQHVRGTALGIRMGTNRLAQVAFPGAVGLVAGPLGAGAAFLCLAFFLTASGAALWRAPIET